ncbi:MAG TPA: hypothetical protein VIY10_03645, partial [Solirubrobacteraceae bacterium]
ADVIGAYEPMVLETPHGRLQTSLAAEPGLYGSDAPCFHRACYAEANEWTCEHPRSGRPQRRLL